MGMCGAHDSLVYISTWVTFFVFFFGWTDGTLCGEGARVSWRFIDGVHSDTKKLMT